MWNNQNLVKVLDENVIAEDKTIELANDAWWDLTNDSKKSDNEFLF